MPEARLRLLVVEDHAETRELMTELLGVHGYDVVAVDSAERGIERLRSERFDVVVSDHWLDGGETGTWLLCTAAAEGLLESTCAIMCSAERKLEAPEGVPLLRKPVDFTALDQTIKRMLAEPPRSMTRQREMLDATIPVARARAPHRRAR